MADVELLPLPELPRQVEGYNSDYWEAGQIEEYAADYARACVEANLAPLQAEIERLRAEVAETREFRDKMANAIGNDQLRRFIEKHGEPVPLTIRMQAAEARAERLAEALRELEERAQRDEALLRQALEALELRCGTHADERKELIPALREQLGETR